MDRRKAMVRDSWDAIADAWGAERRARGQDARERHFLDRFVARMPTGARVLDLGCGSGAPILSALVDRGFAVVGVDLSSVQVAQARARCPTADVREADLAEVDFAPASFHGVVSYDAIWHVPREEHARLLARIASWLVPDGSALLTMGAADGGELYRQLHGAPLFYAAFTEEIALALVRAAGLDVVAHDVRDRHLIVLASRTTGARD
jgi:cyclopropane fatty-acyl-phospholipid synthase-like methyltransferase